MQDLLYETDGCSVFAVRTCRGLCGLRAGVKIVRRLQETVGGDDSRVPDLTYLYA